jgi:membrane protease YdiL (CAAX protease family)
MASSAVLFGLSHGAQQLGGMAIAALLGLVFSLFKKNSRSLHAIALGHALYDLCILLLTFNL